MARPLDPIDLKLLALLEQDARRPVVALARAVGLSRTAVQGRLARLEDEGGIAGYTVVRGPAAHGPVASAILLVTIATRPCETVLKRFADWPEIVACWSVAGPETDAILHVEAASNEAIGDLRERLASVPGVADVTTAPILRTVVRRRVSAA